MNGVLSIKVGKEVEKFVYMNKIFFFKLKIGFVIPAVMDFAINYYFLTSFVDFLGIVGGILTELRENMINSLFFIGIFLLINILKNVYSGFFF